MKEVYLIPDEQKNNAENILKEDETINRGSIIFVLAQNLGFDEDGYFCILDASDVAVQKANELLKDIATIYEKKEEVIEKQKETEDNAAQAFGNLIG